MSEPVTGQNQEIESLVPIQNRGKYASGGIAFFTIGCILSSVSWFVFDASDVRKVNHDLQYFIHGTEMGTSDLPLLLWKGITGADVSDEMLKRVQSLVTTDTEWTDELYEDCIKTSSSFYFYGTYGLSCADEDFSQEKGGFFGIMPYPWTTGFPGVGMNLDPARNGEPNQCPWLSSNSFFKVGSGFEDGTEIDATETFKQLMKQAITVSTRPTYVDKDQGDPIGIGKTLKYCAAKGETCNIKPEKFGTTTTRSLESVIMMCSTKYTMFGSQMDPSKRNIVDIASGLNEGDEYCLQWHWDDTNNNWMLRFPKSQEQLLLDSLVIGYSGWYSWMPDLEKRSTKSFKCELSTAVSDLCASDQVEEVQEALRKRRSTSFDCGDLPNDDSSDTKAAKEKTAAASRKAYEFVHDRFQDGEVACWGLSPTYYEHPLVVFTDLAMAGTPKIMIDDVREKIEEHPQKIAPMLTNADPDDKAITPKMTCDDKITYPGGCVWCDINKEMQSRKSDINAYGDTITLTKALSFAVIENDEATNDADGTKEANTVCKHPLKSLYNFTTTSYYDGNPIDGANYCIYYNLLHRVWTNVGNDPKKSIMLMNVFALVFGGFLLLWHGYLIWTKRDTVLGIHKSGLLPCLIHIAGVIIISVAVFTDVIAYASIACFGAQDWSMDTEAEDILMAVGLVFMGLGTAFLFYVSAVTKSHDAYLGNLRSSDYGRFLDFAITATIVGMASWQWVSLIHGHFHRVQEDSTGDCEDANDLTVAEQVFIWIIVIATTAVASMALLRLIESLMENPDVQRYGTYAKVEAISLVIGLVSLFVLLIILTVNGLQHPTCMTSAHQGNKVTGGREDYDEANELFYIMIAQIVIVCTIAIQPHFEKESGGSDTLTFAS